MQLMDIACNNLRRRKSKMIFLIFGLVFAITTIVALLSVTAAMQKQVETKYNEVGTKLVITPDNNSRSISYGGITVPNTKVVFNVRELKDSAVQQIKSIPDAEKIQVVAPKVLGIGEVNGKKVTLAGVDFAAELKMKSYWQLAGRIPARDDELLIGQEAAAKINKKVGDILNIKGKSYQITGILDETGTEEDQLLFAPLAGVQKLFNKENTLSFIEISIVRNDQVLNNIIQEIKTKLPAARVSSPQKAVEQRKETVDRFAEFSSIISIVMVFVGALIVMTSMMSSVRERTREIGIFKAIGFRKSHVMKIILLEAGLISAFSGLIGYIGGVLIAYYIAPILAQMKVSIYVSPIMAILVILLTIAISLLATLYPATRATKLNPAESLRYI